MENRQFEAMLAVAQERLAQHIPEDIAEKAGAQYADGSFSLKTLGQTVTVRLSDCTIQPPLSKWHALTLLHYLDLADGAPLTGRTITFSQYKDGLVRGGGLDRNAELIVRRDLGILLRKVQRCKAVQDQLADHADEAADQKAPQQILSQRRLLRQPRHIAVIFLFGHIHKAASLLSDSSGSSIRIRRAAHAPDAALSAYTNA